MVEVGFASNTNGTQLEPKNEDCDVHSVLGKCEDSSWRALNWVDFSWYVPTEGQRHSWDDDSDEFWPGQTTTSPIMSLLTMVPKHSSQKQLLGT